jgi:hypothetical protein
LSFPSQTWRFEQINRNYLAKDFYVFYTSDSLAIQHNAEDKRNNQIGQIEYRLRNILLDKDGIQHTEYIFLDIDGIHVIVVISRIELARIVRGDARGIGIVIFRQPTRGSALVACDAVLGGAASSAPGGKRRTGGKRQTGGRRTAAAAVGCCRTVAKTRDVFVGGMQSFAVVPVSRMICN